MGKYIVTATPIITVSASAALPSHTATARRYKTVFVSEPTMPAIAAGRASFTNLFFAFLKSFDSPKYVQYAVTPIQNLGNTETSGLA